uniref:Uncharacterized protein n=1 Tax=Ciona savignyi TaxID=51511 RepID=H2YL17_CIOSA
MKSVISLLSLLVIINVVYCHVLPNRGGQANFDWTRQKSDISPDFGADYPSDSSEEIPPLGANRRQHWSYALSPGGKRQHWSLALSPGGKRQHWSNKLAPGGKRVNPYSSAKANPVTDEENYNKLYNLLRQYIQAAIEFDDDLTGYKDDDVTLDNIEV